MLGNNFSGFLVYKPSTNMRSIMFEANNDDAALEKTFPFPLPVNIFKWMKLQLYYKA